MRGHFQLLDAPIVRQLRWRRVHEPWRQLPRGVEWFLGGDRLFLLGIFIRILLHFQAGLLEGLPFLAVALQNLSLGFFANVGKPQPGIFCKPQPGIFSFSPPAFPPSHPT